MLYSTKTYQTQKKLTNWVRTGSNPEVPGTVLEGLKQYRRLFRNNINNTMEQAFPISFEVLNKEQWKQLIDDFFAHHDAKTPHVWKLPFEFYQFVNKQKYSSKFKQNDNLVTEKRIKNNANRLPNIPYSSGPNALAT